MKLIIDVQQTNKVLSESVGEFKTKLLDQLAHNTKTLFEKNTPKKSGFGSRNYHVINYGRIYDCRIISIINKRRKRRVG